jgi:hypothetical protein
MKWHRGLIQIENKTERKTMSYLIYKNELIATTALPLKSGEYVRASGLSCTESMDASRDVNLINAFDLMVSNAKKWATHRSPYVAVAVNNGTEEFLLA